MKEVGSGSASIMSNVKGVAMQDSQPDDSWLASYAMQDSQPDDSWLASYAMQDSQPDNSWPAG